MVLGDIRCGDRSSKLARHKAWHHWQYANEFSFDHNNGDPAGLCSKPGASCDFFYPHRILDFDFGQLSQFQIVNGFGVKFHSPYQIQAEFDCDVAEMSQPWVPEVVTTSAKSWANNRLANSFTNAAGYKCGDPRPFGRGLFDVIVGP